MESSKAPGGKPVPKSPVGNPAAVGTQGSIAPPSGAGTVAPGANAASTPILSLSRPRSEQPGGKRSDATLLAVRHNEVPVRDPQFGAGKHSGVEAPLHPRRQDIQQLRNAPSKEVFAGMPVEAGRAGHAAPTADEIGKLKRGAVNNFILQVARQGRQLPPELLPVLDRQLETAQDVCLHLPIKDLNEIFDAYRAITGVFSGTLVGVIKSRLARQDAQTVSHVIDNGDRWPRDISDKLTHVLREPLVEVGKRSKDFIELYKAIQKNPEYLNSALGQKLAKKIHDGLRDCDMEVIVFVWKAGRSVPSHFGEMMEHFSGQKPKEFIAAVMTYVVELNVKAWDSNYGEGGVAADLSGAIDLARGALARATPGWDELPNQEDLLRLELEDALRLLPADKAPEMHTQDLVFTDAALNGTIANLPPGSRSPRENELFRAAHIGAGDISQQRMKIAANLQLFSGALANVLRPPWKEPEGFPLHRVLDAKNQLKVKVSDALAEALQPYLDFLVQLDSLTARYSLTRDQLERDMLKLQESVDVAMRANANRTWGGNSRPLEWDLTAVSNMNPLLRPGALRTLMAPARIEMQRRIVAAVAREASRVDQGRAVAAGLTQKELSVSLAQRRTEAASERTKKEYFHELERRKGD